MAPYSDPAPSVSRDTLRLKCVLVGDGAIGKTSLIVSYTTNGYPQEYVPTAYDNYSVLVRVDNRPISLQLCDTAGQDDFNTIRPLCYPNSNVFLLCFSVVMPGSLQSARDHWFHEVKQYGPPGTPLLVVGTQCDLRGNLAVRMELSRYGQVPLTAEDGRDFARFIGAADYIECSALTQHNLKEVFDAAILCAIQKQVDYRGSLVEGDHNEEPCSSKGKKSLRRLKEKLHKSTSTTSSQHSTASLFGASASSRSSGGHMTQRSADSWARSSGTNDGWIPGPPPGFKEAKSAPNVAERQQHDNPLRRGWRRLLCMITS